jgi:hypothetical protein
VATSIFAFGDESVSIVNVVLSATGTRFGTFYYYPMDDAIRRASLYYDERRRAAARLNALDLVVATLWLRESE